MVLLMKLGSERSIHQHANADAVSSLSRLSLRNLVTGTPIHVVASREKQLLVGKSTW